MDLGLRDRVALVTGASRGIGRAIAEALIAEGARVAISSSSPDAITATAAEIGARPFPHDSQDVGAAAALVQAVNDELGTVDVLITNTGGPPAYADALAAPRSDWESAYRSLVLTPMALINAAVPPMRAAGWGRIVNVSSMSVREVLDGLVLSNAHRAATLAAFKTLARQLAGDGVTLNTVLPGRIATARQYALYGSAEQAEREAASQVPAGRLGRVEELAAAAVFLCSRQAGYITGAALLVDGGLTHGP